MSAQTTTLVQVDPTQLTIDANVRREVSLTPEFVQSITDHGVLVPIVAHRTESGDLHVLYGQRRTLAAVEAQRATVPVHVVESLEEADRLIRQVVENDQRSALTDGDRAEAFHQLSLLGMKPTAIARQTGAKRATVQAALAVMTNETAHQALTEGMTLDQAAVIEEFSDHPEDVTTLYEVVEGNPAQFDHTAQRIRDRRAGEAQAATLRDEAEKAGLTVLDDHDLARTPWEYRGPDALLRDLRGAEGAALSAEDATAVVITVSQWGHVQSTHIVENWKAAGFTKATGTTTGEGP